ncbi:MAG: phosphoglucosamine mutase, partial [Bacteroidetes bacterium]|nr:phosphoglucosamine mutase [Bacteroidota bacterium]
MTLIKSISGIRGTIGNEVGESLSPVDIVRFTAAFGNWVVDQTGVKKIVIGRDARESGEMVNDIVVSTLLALGINVVNIGLAPTPTVELAVVMEKAGGGIVITASHNPAQWNALKLLNDLGEFISEEAGLKVLDLAEKDEFEFVSQDKLGTYSERDKYIATHIDKILALPLIDVKAIKSRKFKIAVDCINSVGGISVPLLLRKLGVKEIHELNCEPTGKFAHDPEPLPDNLQGISNEVTLNNADLGLVVDPDVDRLAIVCEDGTMFGEEYSLVSIADYVLGKEKGSLVSNLSSTNALKDIAEKHGSKFY